MKSHYFYDFPGVGKIKLYRQVGGDQAAIRMNDLALNTLHSQDHSVEIRQLNVDGKSELEEEIR